MEFKTMLNIDLKKDDLFEKEVQKAIKAYAKNVAREAIEEEINDEIKRVADYHTKSMKERGYYSTSELERLVKSTIVDYIQKDLKNLSDLKTKVNSAVEKEVIAQEAAMTTLVREQIKAFFNSIDIVEFTKEEIKKQIPNTIIEALKESMK